MKKITIDAGHGRYTNRYSGLGFEKPAAYEGTQMFILAGFLAKELEQKGFEVVLTRKKIDDNPSLEERGKIAGKNGSCLFLSLHSNAPGSQGDTKTTGSLVFYSLKGREHKPLAESLVSKISEIMEHKNLGAKTKASEVNPKNDYYGVIRSAANNGCTCALLLEHGFHTNPNDATFLTNTESLKKLARAEAEIIANYFGHKLKTPIVSKATATLAQAQKWAKANGANEKFISLAPIFWNVSEKVGVNPVVAYCQSAKETAFGNFGGVLDSSFNNPCGMKTSAGGADTDKNAHKRFSDWDEGIAAQIDHLALYAGIDGYPKANTPDPRHFSFIKGRAKTVEDLGGNWAPSVLYGYDIVKMMKKLEATAQSEISENEVTINNAVTDGILTNKEYWLDVLNEKVIPSSAYIKILLDRSHEKINRR